VLTVGKNAREVERKLKTGELACPGCGGRLAPWSYARTRIVFGTPYANSKARPCVSAHMDYVPGPSGHLAATPPPPPVRCPRAWARRRSRR
jgi:hypothetical protein